MRFIMKRKTIKRNRNTVLLQDVMLSFFVIPFFLLNTSHKPVYGFLLARIVSSFIHPREMVITQRETA
jgi:hypothetical protein